MIGLEQAEKRLSRFIDRLWKIEFESGGKQRVRLLPMMALLSAHRTVEAVANWKREATGQREAKEDAANAASTLAYTFKGLAEAEAEVARLSAELQQAYAIAGWHECRLAIARRDGWEALQQWEEASPIPGAKHV